MKTGAVTSGAAHVVLLGALIFSGELLQEKAPRPVNIAEVTLMTGTEFEAALSAAPEFNADLPPSPRAPEPADERADVQLAPQDAAPTNPVDVVQPDAPDQGEQVQPPPEVIPNASIAEVGDQPAAPPAPEAETIVAAAEPTPEIAPVAETPRAPSPAARPSAPAVDTSSPEPEPTPDEREVAEPEPAETEQAEADPKPEDEPAPPAEQEVTKLNDPDIPAPKLAPPPPTKPRDIAEAKKAERLARQQREAEETGATQQAEAPSGGGTSRTVGRLSFRDRDALRVGIKGFFSPPQGLRNPDEIAVKISIELSPVGKIIAGPKVISPGGRLDPAHSAVMRAGVRAIKKSEAAGVFSRLPKDKHERWRRMNVIFTPREIRFL